MFCKLFVLAALLAFAAAAPLRPLGFLAAPVAAPLAVAPLTTAYAAPALAYSGYGYGAPLGVGLTRSFGYGYGGLGYGYGYGRGLLY